MAHTPGLDPQTLEALLPKETAFDDKSFRHHFDTASPEEQVAEAIRRNEMDRHLLELYRESFSKDHKEFAAMLLGQFQQSRQLTTAAVGMIPWAKAVVAMQLIQDACQETLNPKQREEMGRIQATGQEVIALTFMRCRETVTRFLDSVKIEYSETIEAARVERERKRVAAGKPARPVLQSPTAASEGFKGMRSELKEKELQMKQILTALADVRDDPDESMRLAVEYANCKAACAALSVSLKEVDANVVLHDDWIHRHFTPALREAASSILHGYAHPQLKPWANAMDCLSAFTQPHAVSTLNTLFCSLAAEVISCKAPLSEQHPAVFSHLFSETPRNNSSSNNNNNNNNSAQNSPSNRAFTGGASTPSHTPRSALSRRFSRSLHPGGAEAAGALLFTRALLDALPDDDYALVDACFRSDVLRRAREGDAGELSDWASAVTLLHQYLAEIERNMDIVAAEAEKHRELIATLQHFHAAGLYEMFMDVFETRHVRVADAIISEADAFASFPQAAAAEEEEEDCSNGPDECSEDAASLVSARKAASLRSKATTRAAAPANTLLQWAEAVSRVTKPPGIETFESILSYDSKHKGDIENHLLSSTKTRFRHGLLYLKNMMGFDDREWRPIIRTARAELPDPNAASAEEVTPEKIEWIFAGSELQEYLKITETHMRRIVDLYHLRKTDIDGAVDALPSPLEVCLASNNSRTTEMLAERRLAEEKGKSRELEEEARNVEDIAFRLDSSGLRDARDAELTVSDSEGCSEDYKRHLHLLTAGATRGLDDYNENVIPGGSAERRQGRDANESAGRNLLCAPGGLRSAESTPLVPLVSPMSDDVTPDAIAFPLDAPSPGSSHSSDPAARGKPGGNARCQDQSTPGITASHVSLRTTPEQPDLAAAALTPTPPLRPATSTSPDLDCSSPKPSSQERTPPDANAAGPAMPASPLRRKVCGLRVVTEQPEVPADPPQQAGQDEEPEDAASTVASSIGRSPAAKKKKKVVKKKKKPQADGAEGEPYGETGEARPKQAPGMKRKKSLRVGTGEPGNEERSGAVNALVLQHDDLAVVEASCTPKAHENLNPLKLSVSAFGKHSIRPSMDLTPTSLAGTPTAAAVAGRSTGGSEGSMVNRGPRGFGGAAAPGSLTQTEGLSSLASLSGTFNASNETAGSVATPAKPVASSSAAAAAQFEPRLVQCRPLSPPRTPQHIARFGRVGPDDAPDTIRILVQPRQPRTLAEAAQANPSLGGGLIFVQPCER
ncbi:hypothetical protein DIPPA_06297 [Diplonema papillatum]|nr:hypothetical protein DIPPA_06297 [Diplonema papillatum]